MSELTVILCRLEEISKGIHTIIRHIKRTEEHLMSALDDLTIEVQATTDVEESAIKLLEGLATQLNAVAGDPAKVNAIADQLKAKRAELAAAITANTPAPPPAPPPVTAPSA